MFLVLGCNSKLVRHIAESPSLTIGGPAPVEMRGDTKVQPAVNTSQAVSRMAVPEGSRFEFNEKLGVMSLVMAKASEIVVNRVQTAVKGPVAFEPDKGPTIGEEMEAKSDFWTSIGLKAGVFLGVSLAIFGLVRGWDYVMYGGVAISIASLFGIFIQKHPALLLIIGIGTALAIAGPLIWHTKLKKLEPKP